MSTLAGPFKKVQSDLKKSMNLWTIYIYTYKPVLGRVSRLGI